ncbi:MAG: VanZ family protein [Bacteroidaceae bacterium]|nr:VanZ family protein [Bacteroidaceae bacterium]
MNTKTPHRRWPCTTLATAAILILSLAPIPDNPPLDDVPFIDKWVHFIIYGALTCATWLDRHIRHRQTSRLRFAFIALLYAIVIGALTEILQSLTAYRSGEWLDFLADCFGAFLATLLCLPLSQWADHRANG